jgi:hypothetical protein
MLGTKSLLLSFWSCLKLFKTVYNENVPQVMNYKKIKKAGGVHKSGTYEENRFRVISVFINMCVNHNKQNLRYFVF